MIGRILGIARRDDSTVTWFEALRQGQLLLRGCPEGHFSRPDVLTCDVCASPDLTWVPSGRAGVIVARAFDHHGQHPSGLVTELVVVELDEGPWLITRVNGTELGRGTRVRVRVEQPGKGEEGEPYPVGATL
jgi:uncharacterized OB-fold protein